MGNSNSASRGDFGLVSIRVDPPPQHGSNYGGAHVAGTTLCGKEKVRVRYTDHETYTDANGNTQTRSVTRYRNAERNICSIPIPLRSASADESSGIGPGRYVFPFMLDLPNDLPSSMYCSGDGGHCEIKYKVKVEVKNSGVFKNISSDHDISILAKPMDSQQSINSPFIFQPKTQIITTCCCCNRGTITLAAKVNRTNLGKSEKTCINFACQNESTSDILQVTACISERVTWSAGSNKNSCTREIAKQSFQRKDRMRRLEKDEMKELRKMLRRTPSSAEEATRRKEELCRKLYEAITIGDNQVQLMIPSIALDTYKGLCMNVEHKLTIRVQTPSMTDNPTLKTYLRIGTPSFLMNTNAVENHSNAVAEERPPASAPSAPASSPSYGSVPSYNPDYNPTAPSKNSLSTGTASGAIMSSLYATPSDWHSVDGDDGVIMASAVHVAASNAPLGAAVAYDPSAPSQYDTDAQVVIVSDATVAPLLSNLLKELEYTVNAVSTIQKRMKDPAWDEAVFSKLSVQDYASIIQKVPTGFDQPEVAELLGSNTKTFTHDYIVAALRSCVEWQRISVVQKLLPLCVDLNDTNAQIILAELNPWERSCTKQDFDRSIA